MICVAAYVSSDVIDVGLSQSQKLFIKTEDMGDGCKAIFGVHLLCCGTKNGSEKKMVKFGIKLTNCVV